MAEIIDPELLKEYVATANNPKYNSNWDIINGKFPEFKSVDKDLLKEYVATANNPKYNSDWNVINSKFSEFQSDLKKKEPASSAVPNLLKPLPQSGEQPKAGFPTSPSEVMKASTQLESTSQEPPKAPKGMFEIKKLPSEKPEFVERLAKNAEIQEKLLNDPTYALLSGSEDKITKINTEKNKAIAAQRGQTMKEFKSDQDEYLAMFLDDRQKQEFSGIRGRLDLLNEIKKAKSSGESTQELEKIYDKQVKEYSQAKASQVYEADKRIKELSLGLDEANSEEKSQILDEIKLLEASKKPFFINTKKAAAEIVEQEGLEGTGSNQEKVRDYAHALLRERSDLRESLGIKGNLSFVDALRLNTISSGNPLAERLTKVESKLKSVAPVALLNETPITEAEGALSISGKEFLSSFAPNLKSVIPTSQSVASNLKDGLELSGVDNNGITKDALSTLEKTAAPYESWSAKEIAQMTGSTLGFLPKFAIASAATEGLGSLAVISPYWRAITALAEEGTLGVESASPLLKAIQSTKVGRGFLKTAFGATESGIQSAVESTLFSADKNEMNFLTGAAGGALGKVFGFGTDAVGKAFSKSISYLFGNKAPEAASKLLNLAKVAYTKTKEINSRAIGEIGEETGEQLAQIWQESDNGTEFMEKIRADYGEPSKALKFFLSTYMMGFGLSSGTYLGKWSSKKAAESYNDLPPADRAVADDIVSEIRQEQNAAETDAAVSEIRNSDLPEDKKSKLEQDAKAHGEAINNVIEGNAGVDSLKPFESRDLSDSPEKQKEQAEIDRKVEAFQERTGYKPDALSFDNQTQTTLDRLKAESPVDTIAVEEASNTLYAKYKQYENMLNSTSRLMTTEQIKGLMSELEEKITRLENVKNGKDFNAEVETKTGPVEQQAEQTAAEPVSAEPQAVKSYADSIANRDTESGYGAETVEDITGSQHYQDIIAAAKAEGVSAEKVIRDLARSRALDGLETREELEAVDNQIKQDLAAEAKPSAAPEVEPIDEFVDANYQQIMADLKLKNRLTTSGCAY